MTSSQNRTETGQKSERSAEDTPSEQQVVEDIFDDFRKNNFEEDQRIALAII